jgi:integrase
MRKPTKLTQTLVNSIKLPAGKDEDTIADRDAPGLKLRIRREGARVYLFQRRFAGQNPKILIGDASSWTLEAARRRAREMAVDMDNGIDPRVAKAVRIEASKTIFEVVMRDYLEARQRHMKPRSLAESKRHLEKHWAPFHRLPIAGIERATVAGRLRELVKASGPVAADRARSTLRAMYAWAIGEGLVESNPVVGTNKASNDQERERVLSDAELVKVWKAAPDNDYGRILRLCLLLGARKSEIANMRWSEIDRKTQTLHLPRERCKNNRAFALPLSDLAMEIIDSIDARDGRDLVFGNGQGGYSGWSHSKQQLDEVLELKEGFVLHDLRRSFRSGLGRLGVAPHISEVCLNHLPEKLIRTYDKNKYESEKRAAFNLWSAHVEAIVAGKRSNVVALKA